MIRRFFGEVAGKGGRGVRAVKVFRSVEPGFDAEGEEVMVEFPVVALCLGGKLQLLKKFLQQLRVDLVEEFASEEAFCGALQAALAMFRIIARHERFGAFGSEETAQHRQLIFDVPGCVLRLDEGDVGFDGVVESGPRRRRRRGASAGRLNRKCDFRWLRGRIRRGRDKVWVAESLARRGGDRAASLRPRFSCAATPPAPRHGFRD